MSDKKIILVTGCTSGMGLETSRYLYEQGYGLFLVGRNEDKLKKVSSEMGNAPYVLCDLEDSGQIPGIFEYCQKAGIRLSGMVHCAGLDKEGAIRTIRQEDIDRLMRVHFNAFVLLCKSFYNRKVSEDGASIVAISSVSTLTRRKGSLSYTAAKCALNAAVSVASKEFLKRFIRVNAIMPAYVDTRMISDLGEMADLNKVQPMGLIPPRAIAETVEFLLSDKSRFITGAFIPVSAGMDL